MYLDEKGRGRATDFRYVVIVGKGPNYSWLEGKERLNEGLNDLMLSAIERVQQLNSAQFQQEVKVRHETKHKLKQLKELQKQAIKVQGTNGRDGACYELQCSSCNAPIANQEDIKCIQNSHRVATRTSSPK